MGHCRHSVSRHVGASLQQGIGRKLACLRAICLDCQVIVNAPLSCALELTCKSFPLEVGLICLAIKVELGLSILPPPRSCNVMPLIVQPVSRVSSSANCDDKRTMHVQSISIGCSMKDNNPVMLAICHKLACVKWVYSLHAAKFVFENREGEPSRVCRKSCSTHSKLSRRIETCQLTAK